MSVLVSCSCYKRPEFTRVCLPIAIRHANYPCTWHLYDDGSQDETGDILTAMRRGEDVKVTLFRDRQGIGQVKNMMFKDAAERGFEYIVSIDNDLLLPYGWLADLMNTFPMSGFDVGSAWIVNDKTIWSHVGTEVASGQRGWIPVQGFGGACVVHKTSVTKKCFWPDRSFEYADAKFHGDCIRAGYKLGLHLGVQVWHMQWIVWPDVELEREKLKIRHLKRNATLDGFETSFARELAKVIQPGLKH